MGNVVILPVVTKLDVPVDRVLEGATAANLTEVVIIGTTESGEEFFAGSRAGGPDTLWMLERAKLRLLRTVDEAE